MKKYNRSIAFILLVFLVSCATEDRLANIDFKRASLTTTLNTEATYSLGFFEAVEGAAIDVAPNFAIVSELERLETGEILYRYQPNDTIIGFDNVILTTARGGTTPQTNNRFEDINLSIKIIEEN